MRTLLRLMSGVALILVGGYSLVQTLGTEVHKYECEGMLTDADASKSSTLYLRIEENGPFLTWSDAHVRVDAPGIGTLYYRRIDSTGDSVTFSEPHLGNGTFKDLGKDLDVSLGYKKHFTGRCREPER